MSIITKSSCIITRTLQYIADEHNINLIIGNFPYCAYAVNGSYTGTGEWWDLNVVKDTILITSPELNNNSSNNYTNIVLGFYHELGHILDHRQKSKFKDQLACECSAWVSGLRLFFKSEFSQVISKEVVHKRVSYCLSTYM